MNRIKGIWCSLFLLFVVASLQAQQDSVKCESNNGHRNYCGNYRENQVQMERQISGSACIEGQTWGVDRRGLWVDRGCRAYFRVGNYQGGDHRGDGDYRSGNGGGDRNEGWWDRDPDDTWPPRGDRHGGNWERGGACFYKDSNFGGSFFCMRRGEQRASLSGYGDDISSIRVFGGAQVFVFDDRNFSGSRASFRGDVPDLGQRRMQRSDHSWNNRISSLQVQ